MNNSYFFGTVGFILGVITGHYSTEPLLSILSWLIGGLIGYLVYYLARL